MNKNYYSTDKRMLLSRALAVVLLMILGVSLSAWHGTMPVVEQLLSLAGWVLVGIGVIGRIWSASYISGHKNAKLIMDGPYSICRNPLYFFSFVGGLGVLLLTETLVFPLLFVVLFLSYYLQVMMREEKRLQQLHGAAFGTYRSRVPRFWPDFRLFSEPSTYTVSAQYFRQFLTEVVWFVLAAGIVGSLDEMHTAHYLPTLLYIY